LLLETELVDWVLLGSVCLSAFLLIVRLYPSS
jgi:hypothetical protein